MQLSLEFLTFSLLSFSSALADYNLRGRRDDVFINSEDTVPSQVPSQIPSFMPSILTSLTPSEVLSNIPSELSSSLPSELPPANEVPLSKVDTLTFRLTVLDSLFRGEDGKFAEEKEFMAVPIMEGLESSFFYSIELPEDIETYYESLIESGKLYVSIKSATIEDKTVKYSDASAITVLDEVPVHNRKLTATGTRSLAVLRVSMQSGSKRDFSYSVKEIKDHIFNDEVSLKNQFALCSNGDLTIQDAGVYQVTVPGTIGSYTNAAAVRNKALEILAQQQGVSTANALADHVMVMLPPNNFPGFVGNAGVNHWVSTVNDLWSLDVMVYMHEFAHNLGLNHAFLSDNSPDYSSYMSATGWSPRLDGPLKCFNAAGNREMGWFQTRTEQVNLYGNSARKINLAAFSESHKRDNKDPILIEVGEYSIQYNYASEFNAGTEQLRNEVTIAHSESGKTVVQKDGFKPGVRPFSVDNFNGLGKTLRVEACRTINGNSQTPNSMEIGISLGVSGSPCNAIVTPPTTITTPTTTTKPTTTTTTPTTENSLDFDIKPACPDTSKTRVKFKKNKRKNTKRRCKWFGKRNKRLRFCNRKVLNQGNAFLRVRDVCQQECAPKTNACVPRDW